MTPGVRLARRRAAAALALLFALAAGMPAHAQERVLRLEPADTVIRFRVKARAHQVLGTMPLEAGEVRFDVTTGAASGEIVMDPSRADTGVEMRNRTMRDEVFETGKYPRMVFRPRAIVGSLPEVGRAELRLEGTFEIHGGEHELALPVSAEVGDGRLHATTTFEIPYVAWGLKNPGNHMLKVGDVVEVRIDLTGRLE
jgi:polyisoprenoid-binding protein YceI